MKFFEIIYDLRRPDRKYSELYEAIKEMAGEGNWQHPMESLWVVSVSQFSNQTSETMYEALRPYIDDNDSILVSHIENYGQYGWMPMSFWNWFKEKREQQ